MKQKGEGNTAMQTIIQTRENAPHFSVEERVYTEVAANKIAYHGAVKMSRWDSGYRLDKQSEGYYFVTTPDGFDMYGVTLSSDGVHGSCGCAFWEAAKEHEICKHIVSCRWADENAKQIEAAEVAESAASDFRDLRTEATADRVYNLAR